MAAQKATEEEKAFAFRKHELVGSLGKEGEQNILGIMVQRQAELYQSVGV